MDLIKGSITLTALASISFILFSSSIAAYSFLFNSTEVCRFSRVDRIVQDGDINLFLSFSITLF